MFNIGPQELLVVLIVALIIVGPKRLPDLGRTIGRGLNEFRKIQDEVKDMVKFDLGSDPVEDDAMSAAPAFSGRHGTDPDRDDDEDGSSADDVGDGMTHSERVIAALPDDDADADDADEEATDEPLQPLEEVASEAESSRPPNEPPAAAAE